MIITRIVLLLLLLAIDAYNVPLLILSICIPLNSAISDSSKRKRILISVISSTTAASN
jgi:hypothetical protein